MSIPMNYLLADLSQLRRNKWGYEDAEDAEMAAFASGELIEVAAIAIHDGYRKDAWRYLTTNEFAGAVTLAELL